MFNFIVPFMIFKTLLYYHTTILTVINIINSNNTINSNSNKLLFYILGFFPFHREVINILFLPRIHEISLDVSKIRARYNCR